jgi:hypothetical protein
MVTDEALSHLQAEYRLNAQLSVEERLRWIIQDRWINYSRADKILTRLAELVCYPPRARMPSVLVFGDSGMGKTHILEKFIRDHCSGAGPFAGTARVPVACVQMPPYPHEKDFYQELLMSLGTVVPEGLSVVSLRHRVRTLARQLQVRMLVIDEIHAMLQGSFREQRTFLNALRFLANDLRIPLICLGTNEAKQALMTDQQLADRFEAFYLPAWTDDAAFVQLLKSFEAILPLQRPSELWDSKMRKRILSLTDGIMVRICRLLEAASACAIREGTESIEMEILTDQLANESLVSISERRTRRAVG